VALAALEGFAWVAAHVIEVAAMSAVCAVLVSAVVVALVRRGDRRDARQVARGTLLITRADAAPLPPARQRGELAPVINNYFYVADPVVAARVIRQALPAPEDR
jgi:hypothetical protein